MMLVTAKRPVCLCVLIASVAMAVVEADPTLAPITTPDSAGNSVDSNSVITWAATPQGSQYKASDDYDDGGMGLLFSFARGFVNTCFPKGFPYDLIEKLLGGNFDLMTETQGIVMDFLGYAAAVIVGLLFVIIFPIIGCCFCCCRCCGNCGGKKLQQREPSASCKRKVFGVLLLLLVAMAAVGMTCVFVSNDRMTTALNKFSGTAVDNIDDVSTFLDNTIMQVQHVAENNFNFTKQVIFRDLDSLGYLVGIPVRNSLGTTAGITPAINSALDLQTDLDSASIGLAQVFRDIEDLTGNITQLTSNLSTVKTKIDNACTSSCSIDTSGLKTGFDINQIPNITSQMSELETLQSNNLTATILEAKSQFDSIPERVQNETASTVQSLKNQVDDFSSRIAPMINMTRDLKTQALGSINLQDVQNQIKTFAEEVAVYDQYRWYAGIGLSCVVLMIVLMLFLGLAFGVCGSSASEMPTERGCLSTCGGHLLMAAVGFIFIFSWLLMLLTTLTFLIGAPVERFVCQPVSDPQFSVFSKVIDGMKVFGENGSFLGSMLFQDPSVNLTIAGILSDCRKGKTAYTAFQLDNFKGFNITAMTDYKSSLDIEGQMNGINVDLSGVTILTPDMLDKLEEFKKALEGIDFTKFHVLNNDTTEVNLTTFAAELRTAALSPPASQSAELNSSADDLDSIQSGSYADTNLAKNNLLKSSTDLNTSFAAILTSIDAVITNLNSTQEILQKNGSDMVKTEALTFANRLISVVDSYISVAVKSLQDDIGRCTPIYNIYASLLVNGFCHYIWDSLNGFWFSLGWCIFFLIPSVVFAVKLAKHYRRMTIIDSFDNAIPEKNDTSLSNNSGPPFRSNKVAHADKW